MHILKKNVQLMINILYIIDNNSLQELPIFLNPLIQRSLELRDNETLLFIEHNLFSEIVPNILKHVLIANLIN
jgi:hypothetical protein